MALNLFANWEQYEPLLVDANKNGWEIFPVSTLDELVAFARAFSVRKYGQ